MARETEWQQYRHRAPDRPNWRHTRGGDKYVTVIIDLTPVHDGTGSSRLLDMLEGRSKAAFKTWLAARPKSWRDNVEVIAMDGFTGFKTAAAEELPDAVTVMDPFHVIRLAGDALDRCRRRVQLTLHGHRGFKADPLYAARRTLHTGADLLTDRQHDRLTALFADDDHVEVEATWGIYQQMITAYRHPDRRRGRETMSKLITSLSTGVPKPLTELITLGRTLKKQTADLLTYFDHPRTSNGPTQALSASLDAWLTGGLAVQSAEAAAGRRPLPDSPADPEERLRQRLGRIAIGMAIPDIARRVNRSGFNGGGDDRKDHCYGTTEVPPGVARTGDSDGAGGYGGSGSG